MLTEVTTLLVEQNLKSQAANTSPTASKGVMQVEIQHRRHEKHEWTTVEKLDVAYDNEVHELIRKPRGIRHEHELEIANSGEYRIKYNGDSDLTVYCTDIRFE